MNEMNERELRKLNLRLLGWAGYERPHAQAGYWRYVPDGIPLTRYAFTNKDTGMSNCFNVLWPKLQEQGVDAVRFKVLDGQQLCSLWGRNDFSGSFVIVARVGGDSPEIAFCKAAVQLIEEKGI